MSSLLLASDARDVITLSPLHCSVLPQEIDQEEHHVGHLFSVEWNVNLTPVRVDIVTFASGS